MYQLLVNHKVRTSYGGRVIVPLFKSDCPQYTPPRLQLLASAVTARMRAARTAEMRMVQDVSQWWRWKDVEGVCNLVHSHYWRWLI